MHTCKREADFTTVGCNILLANVDNIWAVQGITLSYLLEDVLEHLSAFLPDNFRDICIVDVKHTHTRTQLAAVAMEINRELADTSDEVSEAFVLNFEAQIFRIRANAFSKKLKRQAGAGARFVHDPEAFCFGFLKLFF